MNANVRPAAFVALAALAAAIALPVQAQEATYELPQPTASVITRAAVHADVLQARQAGTLNVTEADRQRAPAVQSARSRADVRAELRADGGHMAAILAEPHGFDVAVAGAREPAPRVVALRLR